jgi:hypothetical protein
MSNEVKKKSQAETQCYQLAWQFINDEKQGELVHGRIIAGSPPQWLNRAWIELPTGKIYEPLNDIYLEKDVFYRETKATPIKRYSPTQARALALKSRCYGPWEELGPVPEIIAPAASQEAASPQEVITLKEVITPTKVITPKEIIPPPEIPAPEEINLEQITKEEGLETDMQSQTEIIEQLRYWEGKLEGFDYGMKSLGAQGKSKGKNEPAIPLQLALEKATSSGWVNALRWVLEYEEAKPATEERE